MRKLLRKCIIGTQILFFILSVCSQGRAQETNSPPVAGSAPTIDVQPPRPQSLLKNQTELGILHVSGNSKTETYNLKEQASYQFDRDILKIGGHYFLATSADIEKARNWEANFRYEHEFSQWWTGFLGEKLESNRFAGFDPRSNSDLGVRRLIVKDETWNFFVESGYRFISEHQVNGPTRTSHNARFGSDVEYKFSDTVSSRWMFEYLANINLIDTYLINTELSLKSQLTRVLALRVAYLIRYNSQPPPGILERSDRFFTTSVVAEF